MKKIYAVRQGRQTGIFNTWADCEAQVKGYAGASYKGFTNAGEAMAWLQGGTAQMELFAAPRATRPVRHTAAAAPETASSAPAAAADYVIYTDGSCLRNPDGPGGWAAVIMDARQEKLAELHDGNPSTTNNRMELSAAIAALNFVQPGKLVDLYTDSQYLKNAFTKRWLENWKRRGWKTAAGGAVKNQDLWQQLDHLFSTRQVRFHWVKGHVGIEHNERCDELAKGEAMKYR
jgi:ribonuclease HI